MFAHPPQFRADTQVCPYARHHPRLRKRFFMSLRVHHIFSMSLRGHPKEAAAISPSSVKYLRSRGDCHVAALLAMTWCPFVPTSTRRLRSLLRAQERSLTHYVPRNDSVKRVSLRVLPLTGAHQKCHSRLTCPRPNRGAGIHPPKADKGTRGQRKRVLLRKDSL